MATRRAYQAPALVALTVLIRLTFFWDVAEEDFVSPVHASIGISIDYDLNGLATAKSSGS